MEIAKAVLIGFAVVYQTFVRQYNVLFASNIACKQYAVLILVLPLTMYGWASYRTLRNEQPEYSTIEKYFRVKRMASMFSFCTLIAAIVMRWWEDYSVGEIVFISIFFSTGLLIEFYFLYLVFQCYRIGVEEQLASTTITGVCIDLAQTRTSNAIFPMNHGKSVLISEKLARGQFKSLPNIKIEKVYDFTLETSEIQKDL